MKRTIEYIPYEMQGIIDYQEIANAVDNYYSIKADELEQLKNNRNILKSDEETIRYYEELLNIIPKSDETLDERRFAIWLKMNNKIPYSEQWLRHWLTSILGIDNYKLTFNYADYSFILRISLSSQNKFDIVSAMLDTIVPAHIAYIIAYLYNTWEEVKNKGTWNDIKEFGTWNDILMSENL